MSSQRQGDLCECLSCGENVEPNECPQSKRECGHHCNHTWSHGACDWCGATFEEPVGDA